MSRNPDIFSDEIEKNMKRIDEQDYENTLYVNERDIWAWRENYISKDVEKYKTLEYHIAKELEWLHFAAWNKVHTDNFQWLSIKNYDEFVDVLLNKSIYTSWKRLKQKERYNSLAQKFGLIPRLWEKNLYKRAMNESTIASTLRFMQFILSSPQYNSRFGWQQNNIQKIHMNNFHDKISKYYESIYVSVNWLNIFINSLLEHTYVWNKQEEASKNYFFQDLYLGKIFNERLGYNWVFELFLSYILNKSTEKKWYKTSLYDDFARGVDLVWIEQTSWKITVLDATTDKKLLAMKEKKIASKFDKWQIRKADFNTSLRNDNNLVIGSISTWTLHYKADFLLNIIAEIEEILTMPWIRSQEYANTYVNELIARYNKENWWNIDER